MLVEGAALDATDVVVAEGLRGQILVISEDDAALARGEALAHLGAERAEGTEGPTALAAPLRAVSVGAVLDHEEPVLVGDLHDAIHVRGEAAVVHGHDSRGARRDGGLNGVGVDLVVVGLDVDDDGDAVDQDDRRRRGDEGRGGHDDLIAGPDSRGFQPQLKRLRAVGAGDRELGALVLSEGVLEPPHPGLRGIRIRAAPPLAAIENRLQSLSLFVAIFRPRDANCAVDRLRSTVDCEL